MNRISYKPQSTQSGFTLIEIAIVLVIIGLLLGGVLQGQQLIENSRVKSATNTFNGIAAAAFSYQDRYGRMPGDDAAGAADATALQARGGSWSGINANAYGDSDGILDAAAANTFDGTGEGGSFFVHLRAAGFITGDPTVAPTSAAVLPTNPFGGLVGVTGQAVDSTLNGVKICMSNLPGSAGIALDQQLDDGSPDSGRLRAWQDTTGATVPDTAAASTESNYDEDLAFTVCYRI